MPHSVSHLNRTPIFSAMQGNLAVDLRMATKKTCASKEIELCVQHLYIILDATVNMRGDVNDDLIINITLL